MENVRVKKSELVEILTKNRAEHEKIYLEAVTGYKIALVKLLKQKLSAAKRGEKVSMPIFLHEPENHLKDYDNALSMLRMSVDDVIELSQYNYRCYCLDDWGWKQSFYVGNSAYSVSAAKMSEEF